MLDELVEFAKKQYPTWQVIPDERLKHFFLGHKDTTIIRRENDKITGFCVYEFDGQIPKFLCIAGTGNRWKNFKLMRKFLSNVFYGKVMFAKGLKIDAD